MVVFKYKSNATKFWPILVSLQFKDSGISFSYQSRWMTKSNIQMFVKSRKYCSIAMQCIVFFICIFISNLSKLFHWKPTSHLKNQKNCFNGLVGCGAEGHSCLEKWDRRPHNCGLFWCVLSSWSCLNRLFHRLAQNSETSPNCALSSCAAWGGHSCEPCSRTCCKRGYLASDSLMCGSRISSTYFGRWEDQCSQPVPILVFLHS